MNRKIVDINTHEFTLESLAELYNLVNMNKFHIKKVERAYLWQALKVNVLAIVGYYAFAGLNYRLKRLEKASKESNAD